MISARHGAALLLLLALALVPTVRHSWLHSVALAPRLEAASVPMALRQVPGRERQRPAAWIDETYGAESWVERSYDLPGGEAVQLFVARGYDLKKLYHHPELGVLHGVPLVPGGTAPLPSSPARVVHVLKAGSPGGTSAVYALLYRGEWVGNPIALQLSSSFSTLWAPRHPLTLVLAAGAMVDDAGRPTALADEIVVGALASVAASDASAAESR